MPVPARPILNADDYAMTSGVSDAILRLAEARRISATSAMTTMPGWLADARRIQPLRGHIAIGLHLNLTLGQPAGSMPSLASGQSFPALGVLISAALARSLAASEVRDEIRRQLDLFETALGFAPDHVDGHQHVQVLPTIRRELLDELAGRYPGVPPLVRDPSDKLAQLASRGAAGAKALVVKALAAGFAASARQRGLPVNDAFAGFSAFDEAADFAAEIDAALAGRAVARAARAIVMCHPGIADAELAGRDPVVQRRDQELDALMTLAGLPGRIWHADRAAGGPAIDWSADVRAP